MRETTVLTIIAMGKRIRQMNKPTNRNLKMYTCTKFQIRAIFFPKMPVSGLFSKSLLESIIPFRTFPNKDRTVLNSIDPDFTYPVLDLHTISGLNGPNPINALIPNGPTIPHTKKENVQFAIQTYHLKPYRPILQK